MHLLCTNAPNIRIKTIKANSATNPADTLHSKRRGQRKESQEEVAEKRKPDLAVQAPAHKMKKQRFSTEVARYHYPGRGVRCTITVLCLKRVAKVT